MSENTEKTRQQILAERQEKKKKKALKKQSKEQKQNDAKNGSNETFVVKSLDTGSKEGKDEKIKNKHKESNAPPPKNKVEHSKKHSSEVKKQLLDRESNQKTKSESSNSVESNNKMLLESIGETIKKPDQQAMIKSSCIKGSPEGDSNDGTGKTKAQLKAERRAKQEAERAKKLEKTLDKSQSKKIESNSLMTNPLIVKVKKLVPLPTELRHKVKLFAHLYDILCDPDAVDHIENVHPSIMKLRIQYSTRVVAGANACCLALLNALKKVVLDFETPTNKEFSRGLESEITKCMSYLSKSRVVVVTMVNAVKHLKFKINQCKGSDVECRSSVIEWIDTYINDQLETAAKAICLFVREKISSSDVILTYGCSSLVQQILISAFKEGINFRVIVADGRPWLEGREMLKKLVSAGIQCTYVFVNGLSFVMPEVTKILLGAHALLANGYVMSSIGSSQVALLAKTYNVPVLVCCETHKFSERVQTDSFVYNELGKPDDLASGKGNLSKALSKWKTIEYLTPLNLMYDVTPPDLVSAVVTEIAVLPCTSVPVILRIKPPDLAL